MRPKRNLAVVATQTPVLAETETTSGSDRLSRIATYIRAHNLELSPFYYHEIPTEPTTIYRWPEDIDGRIIPEYIAIAEHIGYDVETTGLNPRTDKLRLIQLALSDGRVFVLNLEHSGAKNWRAIIAPIFARTDLTLIGHNLAFDLRFTVANGIEWPNAKSFDTMIAAQLLGASTHRAQRGTYTLETLAKKHLGVELDKSLQRSFLDGLPITDEQSHYAAVDPLVTVALADVLMQGLRETGMESIAAIEMGAVAAFARIQHEGMHIDAQQWIDVALAAYIDADALIPQMNAEYRRIAGENATPPLWSSADQVLKTLRKRPGLADIPGTNATILSNYAETDALIPLLLKWREKRKSCTTYGLDWLQMNTDTTTGRIHGSTMQLGTETGRTSSRVPNMQNLPRAKQYRQCFTAPVGSKLVDTDYSQIELRIVAQITQDSRMLEAYRNGEDLHIQTAAFTLDKETSALTKDDRQIAKSENFGLVYGMGVAKFIGYARTNYHVTFTEEEATLLRYKYFQTYRGVKRWHQRQTDEYTATRTLGNRRRKAVISFSEKLNSPVQGTGADMLKLSLARLYVERHRYPTAKLVNTVHDEIIAEVPTEDADAVAAWISTVMQESGQIFLEDVPVLAEPSVCDNWAEK